MTLKEYLAALTALYRVANMADSDNPERPEWLRPEMAATICQPLDKIIQALEKAGAISAEEFQSFYDNL